MYVMLTVDLKNADSGKRVEFDRVMEEKQWVKLKKVTTTYQGLFKDSVTIDGIKETTRVDLDAAVRSAEIMSYDYAASISEEKPFKSWGNSRRK